MVQNIEKLTRAREILSHMAEGVNPLNGKPIDEKDFVHNPEIVRCFFYLSEVLKDVVESESRSYKKKLVSFSINEEEKRMVKLPEGKIGISDFAKCVNQVINPFKSKKLTGVELNRQLKKMGILSEGEADNGSTRTVTNEKSGEYGIESEARSYNGRQYEAVLFNEQGKRFLLDNLEKIMNY